MEQPPTIRTVASEPQYNSKSKEAGAPRLAISVHSQNNLATTQEISPSTKARVSRILKGLANLDQGI